jgi:hypothetical protein
MGASFLSSHRGVPMAGLDASGCADAIARLKRSAGDPGDLVRQPLEPSPPAPKCEAKLHREIFSGQTIVRQLSVHQPLSGRAAPLFAGGLDRGAVRLSREIR